MQRYIAFLGGLPIGYGVEGMDELRRLFSQLGFSRVETFLTTGNVAFETAPVGVIAPLEAQVTRYLQKNLDDSVEVFMRTPEQLSEMLSYDAFPGEDIAAEGASLFIVLLHEPISAAVERRLRRSRTDVDDFHSHGNSIYWLRRPADGEPSPPPAIGEVIAMPATVRTLSTIRALVAKYGDNPTPQRRDASDHERTTESERFRP
jgi:uncharacterized protein (DUF1697 family)